jgi:hypothetical protein
VILKDSSAKIAVILMTPILQTKFGKNIQQSLPLKKEEKHFTIRDIYKWSAAAAIFFIALTSAYFLFIRKASY